MSESQTATPQSLHGVGDDSQTPTPQNEIQKEDSGLESDRIFLDGGGDQGGGNPFDIELTQVKKILVRPEFFY